MQKEGGTARLKAQPSDNYELRYTTLKYRMAHLKDYKRKEHSGRQTHIGSACIKHYLIFTAAVLADCYLLILDCEYD